MVRFFKISKNLRELFSTGKAIDYIHEPIKIERLTNKILNTSVNGSLLPIKLYDIISSGNNFNKHFFCTGLFCTRSPDRTRDQGLHQQ